MFSVCGFLFFKNLLYNFCFRFEDFKRPLVIEAFYRVSFLTQIVFIENTRSYIHKKTSKKLFIGISGLDVECRFPKSI